LAAAGAAACAYLLLVGPRPSLVRASLMVLLATAALAARRSPSTGNALAVAAACIVLGRPRLVADLGFQLTVAATAGIVFLAPRLARSWLSARRPPPRWLAGSLAATVAAQLASLPWALPRLHLLSLASPILNLVAVPWTALALVASLGWTALAALSPPAGAAVLPLLDALAAPFGWPALGSPQCWGTVAAAAPVPAVVALALLLIAGATRPRRRWPLLLPALLAGVLVVRGVPPPPTAAVEVVLFDVGQGESILLRDGDRTALVDGGGWRHGDFGGRVLLPALLAEGVRRLDAMVLSHPDSDHCRGLVDLASYLPVAEVWTPPGWRGDPCADALTATPGAVERQLVAGDRLRLGRWRLAVLHPPAGEGRGRNERSLVILAAAEGRRLLLTGDIGVATERLLTHAAGASLAADLLKLAHHGSGGSNGPALLAAVRPRLALVSAGPGNVYGHPAAVVVARLDRARVPLLRTDRHGLVRLTWQRGGALHIELPASPR
jgi:competence protein ComEC